ncbi:MAG TPA: patatin-like protein [Pyrinomonadaceae bacterium]|nr:patatin-like protein [Pyrinomonadaceae bacterium]
MTTNSPPIDPAKEIRFSVVMYGGVSLAIYINGVSQELFHMTRATAKLDKDKDKAQDLAIIPGDQISGTERVYRKLAYLLSDQQLLADYRAYLEPVADPGNGHQEDAKLDLSEAQPVKQILAATHKQIFTDPVEPRVQQGQPISIRFIVDVLSGTSAGGINAIYLAKAFANNQQIDQLKDLWINEGDIALLLNDKMSVAGTGLLNQSPPQSLLNSRRMYQKLLKSLNGMEEKRPSTKDSHSAFVDELDLYITTTDIEGVPVPLRLSDAIVYERRHRNVFHFKYGKEDVVGVPINDFRAEFNPFLAFAARCTSSFPFAFEPMRLSDIDEVLDLVGGEQKGCQSDNSFWQRFFQEEIDPKTNAPVQPPRFAYRSFGDGGYLDNKPFSYATETTIHRQSNVPVDRKLIYIEPSPDHPEDRPGLLLKPNSLQNVKAAVLDLPTYETIREDLQRILERNQLIERVNRIIGGIEKDVNKYIRYAVKEKKPLPVPMGTSNLALCDPRNSQTDVSQDWSTRDMAEVVQTFGRYILPYRRLRISAVTDDIAKLVARLTNFDENSDQFLAIRYLVRAWREENYAEFKAETETTNETGPTDNQAKETVNAYLSKYDLSYRLRRLNFVRSKVDQLMRLDQKLLKEMAEYRESLAEIRTEIGKEGGPDLPSVLQDHPQVNLLLCCESLLPFTRKPSQAYVDALRTIKGELNDVFKNLRTCARLLRSRRSIDQTCNPTQPNPLLQHIAALGITAKDLNEILGVGGGNGLNAQQTSSDRDQDDEDCFARAVAFLQGRGSQTKVSLKRIGDELATGLQRAIVPARMKCRALFHADLTGEDLTGPDYEAILDKAELLESEEGKAIRGFLGYYYDYFDDYDQISFPIFYETEVGGEADVIDVIRISPEDATSLIDERKELRNSPDPLKARKKLAGVALHHFGAFLDRSWRQNDIMWGRLDGAERLITALLPGEPNQSVRKQLIKDANLAILREELKPESVKVLQSVIAESLISAGTGTPISVAIERTIGALADSPKKTQLEKIISLSIEDDRLLDFMSTGYEVNRQLDSKLMLKSVSRATQIVGNMFEQMAHDNGLEGKRLRWIAQLGKLFWGLVEVAVPNSMLNLMATHWLHLLYLFEVMTILGGILLARSGAQQFGWTALGITAFLHVVMLLLNDKMRGRTPVRSVAGLFVAGVLSLFLLIGALKVVGLFGLRLGRPPLTPLAWLGQFPRAVLSKLGPTQESILSLLLLIGLLLFIGLLSFTSGGPLGSLVKRIFANRKEKVKFKPIKLKRLEKQDMANVRLANDGTTPSYAVLAQLSAAPPPNWIEQFDNSWTAVGLPTQMRVSGAILSFTAAPENLALVWSKARETIATTNQSYAECLAKQNQEFANLKRNRIEEEKKEQLKKWNLFKGLR